ncbi:excinuclease ABC subunit B [Candidatus Uhrbacteria bacterium RIFCSPLOWO2_12_FULL_46_10]|uniref:Excinuclease ABC subunit B n=1 Tax=Candidatus Uhrbacteria bacterium RIFCSPLOWO2_01_FULL_47_25 TaxID=1802402 RepID=A0A1F7UTM8_9BACT|nr:MAG: excinuclease ABC subunit B [Candidatus Uhrbacteria bacterium RIFCSPHIGHO2_01_FULL_46_23]OGL69093.1 MAG: excinuclease ABC subunit B [Candidatus Uhrbacteria bacterium RIFCSPHIGHO2_02_FULL_47_29]OGL75719.1 MAG: excinuclease ABC subunit B [Candidatus Uhrbacteria bacterium RIFCSPHIGHO2_12_FULL_46_13]OGL81609.1 MAG: excinuclease ABC subunit B [Candidatus Uhrbacteria bacterium RIFCSPLOWO2_01_FULL_47_25]OGL84827.1 MAG: excinuclease ABC subunit B [Candidatus Uhrbacteria bacterium RIFCSPLOWO2_02_
MRFKIVSRFKPTSDQPEAIRQISTWLKAGERHQTLLGVTGSGKTFTMAKVIEELQRPTLVISPNKTLAAQLYSEFKQFFPDNAVHYFVSYYDYYQPEAYIPQTDTYIAKEAMINDEIDRLRHAATQSLLTRPDVLIVASVSCIYGLGSPLTYQSQKISIQQGEQISRQKFLKELVAMQYNRNDIDFGRGTFRARGDIVEIHPVTGEDIIRVEWLGDILEKITLLPNIVRKKAGQAIKATQVLKQIDIYPAKHFVTPLHEEEDALKAIRAELKERLNILQAEGKELEAQRLEQRTNYDLELIATTGYCNGIENYSRHFDRRHPGQPPFALLDYFTYAVKEQKLDGYLTFLDESHIVIPQLRGMYAGDYSRKQMLVDYGWRLPSAFDNRPLNFQEFSDRIQQLLYVSATPNDYELSLSGAKHGFKDLSERKEKSVRVAQQLIRPTGILDPEVVVRPTDGQLDDLMVEIRKRISKSERTLVTTLTKRLAEELTDYLAEAGIKVQYLHSDVETLERVEILKSLRAGVYDVVVGINLLREGLDLPEVSLVAILDADKEGFLRNETTLIQTMGRAARHVEGKVIMYADTMTSSMKRAIAEVERRRAIQRAYNKKHGITPQPIERSDEVMIVDYIVK